MAEEAPFDVADVFQPSPSCMPIIDPGLKEFGRLWIHAEHIEPTKAYQRWRSGARVQPSLCMLFQGGQCNGGPKCNQAHVKLPHMAQVRQALQARPFSNCCLSHGDLPSRRRDFLALLDRCSIQLKVPGQPVPLHPKLLAITGFFDAYLLEMANNADLKPAIAIDPARVCNLHQKQQCKYGADCHNVHVCRHFWASVSRRPSSPPAVPSPTHVAMPEGQPPTACPPPPRSPPPEPLAVNPHPQLVAVPVPGPAVPQPAAPPLPPTPVGVAHMMVPVYTITLSDGSSISYTPQLAFMSAQPPEGPKAQTTPSFNALPMPPQPPQQPPVVAPMPTLSMSLPPRPAVRPPLTHSASTGALPSVATPLAQHCPPPPPTRPPGAPTSSLPPCAPRGTSLAPLASLESRTAASISRRKRRESAPDIPWRPVELPGMATPPAASSPSAGATPMRHSSAPTPTSSSPAAVPTPLEVWTPEAWMQSRRASAPAPSMGSPFAVGMASYLSHPFTPSASSMKALASFRTDTEPATPNTITSECASSFEHLECDSDAGSDHPSAKAPPPSREPEAAAQPPYADLQALFQGNFHFLDAAAVGLDLPANVMNELKKAAA